MRLKLHSAAQNSAGERVRIALNLKGLEFEYIPVSNTTSTDYIQRNPHALIPTLEVDGVDITQSLAAIEYLEDRFPEPTLLPADPALRAHSRSFAMAVCSELHSLTVRRVRRYLLAGLEVEEPKVENWYAHWTQVILNALEAQLATRTDKTEFCYADFPTFADIALVPQLANARRFNCDLSGFPILQEIEARCIVLPAFANARPEKQIDYTP